MHIVIYKSVVFFLNKNNPILLNPRHHVAVSQFFASFCSAVFLGFLALGICAYAEKPGSEGFITTSCRYLSYPPVILGHQVNKEMTNRTPLAP